MVAALIPGIATQVTVYQIDRAASGQHPYGYIFLMLGTDVIAIYIFLQFFENLPKTLDEAAILDGCSYFGVFSASCRSAETGDRHQCDSER
ncbi:MAG: hypothetical protein ACLUOF_01875 [Ruminococcus sp.]